MNNKPAIWIPKIKTSGSTPTCKRAIVPINAYWEHFYLGHMMKDDEG